MSVDRDLDGWARAWGVRVEIPPREVVVGLGVVTVLGFGSFWLHLFRLFRRPEGLFASFLGTVLPLGLAVVLFVIGTWTWVHWEHFEAVATRIGSWCFAGTVVLVGVSVTSIAYQQSMGVRMADPLFAVANHATVGAILGTLMGVYDGQRHVRGQDLLAEREEVERLNNRMTILNRVLRHDIRNTVNIIIGNAELVRNGTSNPEQVADTISTRARDLQTMSDRARKLVTVLEADSVPAGRVDIAPVLRAKAFKLNNQYPSVTLKTDIPETAAVCAVSMMEEALEELLENAIEHNDSDEPHIELAVDISTPDDPTDECDPDYVTIRVRDNGPTIPVSEVEVFERGYETALSHATGLGLWMVSWAVDESGGEVTFEENDPQGSVVELRLPRPEA